MNIVHFIGIGGISMSALAAILHNQGLSVSGSDLAANTQTEWLSSLNIEVFKGHSANNLPTNCSQVIINGAISEDNPELLEAKRREIRIVGREELLATVSKSYKNVIAVAGAHGKSTTTAMLASIFTEAGLEPTVHNGAAFVGKCCSLVIGKSDFFITEACEFKRSFLSLSPTVGIITNIDADHLDCYKNLEELQGAYLQFASRCTHLITEANYKSAERFNLRIPGEYNQANAQAAAAVARHFGIEEDIIRKSLENFGGISRRFEYLGVVGRAQVISDYAHHPTEIVCALGAVRKLFGRYLVIFQPHTYTRTKALFDDFVTAFAGENAVFYKTYSAREKEIPGGRAKDLAAALKMPHFESSKALKKHILKQANNYDAIIFMGAGDIDGIAREF